MDDNNTGFKVSLLLVSMMVLLIRADHFRGAIIQWRPVYNGLNFTGDVRLFN